MVSLGKTSPVILLGSNSGKPEQIQPDIKQFEWRKCSVESAQQQPLIMVNGVLPSIIQQVEMRCLGSLKQPVVSKTTSAYQCYFLGYSSFRMSHCEFAPQQVVPHMIPNQFGRSQVARPVDCTAVRCCLEGSDLEVYPQVSISTSRDPFGGSLLFVLSSFKSTFW